MRAVACLPVLTSVGCGILSADDYSLGAGTDGGTGKRDAAMTSAMDVSAVVPSIDDLAATFGSAACRDCRLSACRQQLEACVSDSTCVGAMTCDCTDPACVADCWRDLGLEDRQAPLAAVNPGDPWADLLKCVDLTCQGVCVDFDWQCAHSYSWPLAPYRQRFQLENPDGYPLEGVTVEACRVPGGSADQVLADDCDVPVGGPWTTDERGIVEVAFDAVGTGARVNSALNNTYLKFSGPQVLERRIYSNRPWAGSAGATIALRTLLGGEFPGLTLVATSALRDCSSHRVFFRPAPGISVEWIAAQRLAGSVALDAGSSVTFGANLVPGQIATVQVTYEGERIVDPVSFPTRDGEAIYLLLWPEEQ